jgi:hypothetical protein
LSYLGARTIHRSKVNDNMNLTSISLLQAGALEGWKPVPNAMRTLGPLDG